MLKKIVPAANIFPMTPKTKTLHSVDVHAVAGAPTLSSQSRLGTRRRLDEFFGAHDGSRGEAFTRRFGEGSHRKSLFRK